MTYRSMRIVNILLYISYLQLYIVICTINTIFWYCIACCIVRIVLQLRYVCTRSPYLVHNQSPGEGRAPRPRRTSVPLSAAPSAA